MAGGVGKIDEYNKSLTPEQRRENSIRAGKMSGVARRHKKRVRAEAKLFAEIVNDALNLPLKNKGEIMDAEKVGSLVDLGKENMATKTAIVVSIIKKALDGNLQAAEMLMKITGEISDKKEIAITGALPVFYQGEDKLED